MQGEASSCYPRRPQPCADIMIGLIVMTAVSTSCMKHLTVLCQDHERPAEQRLDLKETELKGKLFKVELTLPHLSSGS